MRRKIARYCEYAKTLGLTEALRRAPASLKSELRRSFLRLRWSRFPPAIPQDAVKAGCKGLGKFPWNRDRDALGGVVCAAAARDPELRDKIVENAEAILDGRFRCLGEIWHVSGSAPDWHLDFKSGFRWPSDRLAPRVRETTPPGADLKVPWEISRSEWLLHLGLAWRLTGDVRYAETAGTFLLDWIEKNPVARGVNWICPMDVGMRAAVWCWGMAFFHSSEFFGETLRQTVLSSLWEHGHYIREHLEFSPCYSGNHYLGDLIGLLHVGLVFREHPQGETWLRFAWEELETEIGKQVLPDGGDFEASVPYHRLVLEFFSIAAFLGRHYELPLAKPFSDRLRSMFHFVKGYLRPDGQAPQIGDNDSGRAFSFLPRAINDHRYLLSWGALLLNDSDFKIENASPELEAACLHGPDTWEVWDALPEEGSPSSGGLFPDFGLAILKDWRRGDSCSLFAGPVGQNGKGGHSHNDKLSLELMANSILFVVDPGTGCYAPAPEWRNRFRATASHSTLQLGDEEQTPFRRTNLFRLGQDPKARVIEYASTEQGGRIVGRHHGWTRFDPPRIHEREIEWSRDERQWTIRDRLFAPPRPSVGAPGRPSPPNVGIHWVLHPKVSVEILDEFTLRLATEGVRVSMRTPVPCRREFVPWWYSPEYGVWEETRKIVFHPELDSLDGAGFSTLFQVEASDGTSP